MAMIVHCTSCQTEFPVDPAKVPEDGVLARCSECPEVFRVERPLKKEVAPAVDEGFVTEEAAPEADLSVDGFDAAVEEPAAEFGIQEGERTLEPEPAAEEPEPKAAGAGRPNFSRRDPKDRAARLARVLVSDIVLYNSVRHEKSMEAGTIREDFQDEVDKSWIEWVEQVGSEIAESTDFWKEALNEILAKGEKLF